MTKTEFSIAELAAIVGGTLDETGDTKISGVSTLVLASSGELSFLGSAEYKDDLPDTKASVVLIKKEDADLCPCSAIVVSDPYLAYAQLSRLFERPSTAQVGVHATAVVDESAVVDVTARVGARCIVEAGACIAAGAILEAGSSVGAGSEVGENSRVFPNAVIYSNVKLGRECRVQAGAVIGADGFGYARDGEVSIRIEHLGGVRIGDDVDIGANTTIDRGTLDDTVIGNHVKIDNQVQIAHNVKIGDNTVICGCTGIAGSSVIGRNCTLAGGVGITGHLELADGVVVTSMSLVSHSIHSAGVYSSGTGLQTNEDWRKSAARFRKLDDLARRVQKIEKG